MRWFALFFFIVAYSCQGQTQFLYLYQDHVSRIKTINYQLKADPAQTELYQEKAKLIRELIEAFRNDSRFDFQLYDRYRVPMDTLRYSLITNSVRWIDQIPIIKQRSGIDTAKTLELKALINLGYAYVAANDKEYAFRVAEKLDTLGYNFPYIAHGPTAGISYGNSANINFDDFSALGYNNLAQIDIGYTLGYLNPRNRLLSQKPTWTAFTLGLSAVPEKGLIGFCLGGQFPVYNRFFLGLQCSFVGKSEYFDQGRNSKNTVFDAYILRPEFGYQYGVLHSFVAYNFAIGNSQVPKKNQDIVTTNWPKLVLGLRISLPFRTWPSTAERSEFSVNKGLNRRYDH